MAYTIERDECQDLAISTKREWLLTNGIGGYAMGTVSTINTRRYHGLLVAAVHPPTDRMVMLAGVECRVVANGEEIGLSSNQYPGTIYPEGYQLLQRFVADGSVMWE